MFERMLLYNAGINVTQNGILFAVLLCLSITIYDKRFISRFQTFFLKIFLRRFHIYCMFESYCPGTQRRTFVICCGTATTAWRCIYLIICITVPVTMRPHGRHLSATVPSLCASWSVWSNPGSGTSRRTCPPLCRRLLHTTNRSIVFSTWRQSAPPTVIHAHISLSAHQMTHRSVRPFLQSAAVCSINKWTVTFATRCLLFITRRVFLQAGKTSVNIFSPGQGLKMSSPRSKLLLYKFLINLYKSVFIPARRYASALSTVAMRLWQIGVRSKRTDRSSWFFGVAASFYLAYTVL